MAGTVRTAIATFNDPELLEAAVIDLEEHGFDRAEISLLAGERTVEKKLGHRYARVDEIGDTDDTPNRAFVEKGDYTEAKSGLIGGLFYVGALAAAGAVVASGRHAGRGPGCHPDLWWHRRGDRHRTCPLAR